MNSPATAPALGAPYLASVFERALAYDAYVATGDEHQQRAWNDIYEQASVTPEQRALLSSFVREVKVLVSSGIWCGDCVQQCPLLARLAGETAGRVDLRFVDRDAFPDLRGLVRINGGDRVPVAIFMAEDFQPVSVFGDRTLSRYRALAARALGPSCPLPGTPVDDDELAATMQDWLDEIERVHLLLRLSTRLRQKHGD